MLYIMRQIAIVVVFQDYQNILMQSGLKFVKVKINLLEMMLFQYKRAIILNGINCPATREDILDRSILINLKRIKNYKEERVIFNEWNALKPELLDLIFNTLVKALQIYNTTNIDINARTADWLKWGYCISESIKNGLGKDFLASYKDNVSNQNDQVIENNVLVQAVLEFMER